jgi:hypothetical protein
MDLTKNFEILINKKSNMSPTNKKDVKATKVDK